MKGPVHTAQRDRWRPGGEWFLILMPLFFALHQYAELAALVTLGMALQLFLDAGVAALLLLALSLLLLRRFRTAALLTVLLLFLYLFFGPLQDSLRSLWSFPARYAVFLPLLALLVVAATIYLLRAKPVAQRLVKYLNITLLVLISVDSARLFTSPSHPPQTVSSVPAQPSAPSVFLLVADEYAGPEVLQAMGYDNTPFIRALEARGFTVARHSRSNYNFTPYSMASLLEMDYLGGLEGRNSSKGDRAKLYPRINENAVVDHFRKRGYDFVNLSPFRFAGIHPQRQSGRFFLSGADLLRAPTLPARLDRDLRFALVTRFRWTAEMRRLGDYLWEENRQTLEALPAAAAQASRHPRLVYAHLMMPHYPYLFNSRGQRTPPEAVLEGAQVNTAAYIEYLKFSNGKLLQVIDEVVKSSPVPPVILLIGDHGFRHLGKAAPPHYAFSNFNAVLLPGKPSLPDSITLVNQFRWVLNTAFGAALPYKNDLQVTIKE